MTSLIPESHLDVVDRPIVGILSSVSNGGIPSVTPVWVEWGERTISFSTASTTTKWRNLKCTGASAICFMDPRDPYRYLEVKGHLVDSTSVGAHEHLDFLAQRYMGKPRFPRHDYQVERVLITLEVTNVVSHGAARGRGK